MKMGRACFFFVFWHVFVSCALGFVAVTLTQSDVTRRPTKVTVGTRTRRFFSPTTLQNGLPARRHNTRRLLPVVMLFDKFGPEAVNCLMYAQQETRRVGLEEVGTEQLLLGIVHNPDNAERALKAQKITLNAAQKAVAEVSNSEPAKGGWLSDSKLEELFRREEEPLPFAAKTKQVFRAALKEAEALSSEEVRSEHLLLAVLRDADCTAVKVLDRMEVDVPSLRQTVETDARKKVTQELVGAGASASSAASATLENCGQDLTALAAKGELDPCVGRESQLARVMQILVRRRKSNPCLVGDPGVGKTAVVEGLASLIAEGKVPARLRGKRVHSLEMSMLVAGTKYRGEFEDRLRAVIEEAQNDENLIIFIDEMHTLVGAGAAEGAIDAANILKPALARSGIQCIGATTLDEYRKYVEKDAALERRFQPVSVPEPSVDETVEILTGLKSKYEEHHGVSYSPAAVEAAATYSKRYVNDRFLPDKAIDLLDEAGATAQVRATAWDAPAEAVALSSSEDDDAAADVPAVTEDDVASAVSQWTGVPVEKLSRPESLALLDLERRLHESVVGQRSAVRAVSRAVRRARAGVRGSKRPVASFLFAGPTGTGKTFVAKALAETYYGDADSMVRFDMGEFSERHAVARLVGSPPGYVGFDDGGQLTNAVRRRPHTLVLFDEIEKAHSDVYNVFLGLLEDGRVRDAKGRVVDFTNVLVIFTSNVGSQKVLDNTQEGTEAGSAAASDDDDAGSATTKKLVTDALREEFRPEFLNRLDEIVVFDPLSDPDLREILDLQLDGLFERLAEPLELEKREIIVEDALKRAILQAAADRRFGARPLRRAVQRFVEDPLAECLLADRIPRPTAESKTRNNKQQDQQKKTGRIHLDYDALTDEVLFTIGDSNNRRDDQTWRVAVDNDGGGGIEDTGSSSSSSSTASASGLDAVKQALAASMAADAILPSGSKANAAVKKSRGAVEDDSLETSPLGP